MGKCWEIDFFEENPERAHRCTSRMTTAEEALLDPSHPPCVDPLQDSIEYCTTNIIGRTEMSSYEARQESFVHEHWPKRLWSMSDGMAAAGFYWKGKYGGVFLPTL